MLSTEDLRMRMGDIRNGDTDGLWVRTYARKDSASGHSATASSRIPMAFISVRTMS